MGLVGHEVVGLICVGIASLCFGSNFVVTKKYKTGDGMSFQLFLGIGIWLVGLIVYLIRGCPEFQAGAMLGGFIWATANLTVVPIVKTIGLSMGLLLWGATNNITGWASGKFGYLLLGLKRETVAKPGLNYLGVFLSLVALAIYVLVKSTGGRGKAAGDGDSDDNEKLLGAAGSRGVYGAQLSDAAAAGAATGDDVMINGVLKEGNSSGGADEPEDDDIWVDHLSPVNKRLFGVAASVLAGVGYGLNFDPPQYIKNNVAGSPQNLLDYVFPHFTGILLTTLFYFVVYALWTKNKPVIYRETVCPAILSGTIWAVAQSSWFVANNNLSFIIAFPLVAMGPGIVGAVWGVFVFREITGTRNYIILVAAFIVSVVAAIVLVYSKVS